MVKLTNGKPPFFGVVFENMAEAELNKDLLELKSTKFSIMIMDYGKERISFRLLAENPIVVGIYDNLKYDAVLFRQWRIYTYLKINFGHVILNDNKPEIIRINGRMFVLPISIFLCA